MARPGKTKTKRFSLSKILRRETIVKPNSFEGDVDQISEEFIVPTKGSCRELTQDTSHPQAKPLLPTQDQNPQINLPSTIQVDPKLLWDEAYDALKEDSPALLDAYERILSHELDESSEPSTKNYGNSIEPDNPDVRRYQMKQLVGRGLKKAKNAASAKQGMGNVLKIALAANDVIATAIQGCPQAALAWTGVSLAIQMLSNPGLTTETNRVGLDYVLQKMNFYWDLSSHILKDRGINGDTYAGLRLALKSQIVDLYKALLTYQMMSVCSYYRSPTLSFLRNMIQLDDWDGSLASVREAEEVVLKNSQAYNNQQIMEHHQYDSKLLEEIKKNMKDQGLEQNNIREKEDNHRCLRDLRVTDPAVDMERIEHSKGSLLAKCYAWFLSHPHFVEWKDSKASRLLWIKGGPGKGKTMLMIGIVKELELQKLLSDSTMLCFFFCQETDANINNATSVLRGLIYQMLCQDLSLISHLRDQYDKAGSKLFEGPNAFFSLRGIFADMISDPKMKNTSLIVDALDECQSGLNDLLRLILESLSKSPSVKWIISSRHQPTMERLLRMDGRLDLDLEKNAEIQISQSVDAYINHNMSVLTTRFKETYYVDYESPEVIQELETVLERVSDIIHGKAAGTFLWASLIFQQIEDKQYDADRVLDLVHEMPSGLNEMYDRMMRQMLKTHDSSDCKRVLLIVVNSYRPLQLAELKSLAGLRPLADVRRIIKLCSILSTKGDDEAIHFVHQSAKEFITQHMTEDMSTEIFPNGHSEGHRMILVRSIESMSERLQRDIYKLKHPAFPATEVRAPRVNPLAAILYSCVFWINHLYELTNGHLDTSLSDDGIIAVFWKKHFLHWLEALSLMRKLSVAANGVTKLTNLLETFPENSQFPLIVKDAHRFLGTHAATVEKYPLQLYSSALLFSPTMSLTRKLFRDEEPEWTTTKPAMESEWGACLLTLKPPGSSGSVAFSPDGKSIASTSEDTVIVWDMAGTCLQTLQSNQCQFLNSVAFTPDGGHVYASGREDYITFWDKDGGRFERRIEGTNGKSCATSLSPDGMLIVTGSFDNIVRIWSIATGVCLRVLEGHTDFITSVQFSSDGAQVVSGSKDCTIRIWNTDGTCLMGTIGGGDSIISATFSPDKTRIVSTSWEPTIKVWDTEGTCLQTLQGHRGRVTSASFSPNGAYIASSSSDKTIRVWDKTGACVKILEGHALEVKVVCFSPDGTWIASGSDDQSVRIWDLKDSYLPSLDRHSDAVMAVVISPDGTRIVSGSSDHTLKIWKISGVCLKTLYGHKDSVMAVVISPDGTLIVSGSRDKTVKIWNFSGTCLTTLYGHNTFVNAVAISPDGTRIISGSYDHTLKIWDLSGICLNTLRGHCSWINAIAISSDGTRIVSGSNDRTIKIWDFSGTCLMTLSDHISPIAISRFSEDGKRIVSWSELCAYIVWDACDYSCLEATNSEKQYNMSLDASGGFCPDIGIGGGTRRSIFSGNPTDAAGDHSFGIDESSSWITFNGENLLLLPPEYRSITDDWGVFKRIARLGNVFTIGCAAGNVLVFEFSTDKPPIGSDSPILSINLQ